MKRQTFISWFLAFVLFNSTIVFTGCSGRGYIEITELRTNNMANPLGLDEVPVFGWTISSNVIGIKQIAYSIDIYEEGLGDQPVWSTGRIESDRSANVELDYSKAANLKDETNYVWTVTVWDNTGNMLKPAETGKFSTGLAYELCTCNDVDFDNTIEATFGPGATYIGNAEIPLDADALTVYRLSYDFQIKENGNAAGFIYGANEYRFSNAMYNDFLIEGENYINVVVDISGLKAGNGPAQVKVFRKGYSPADYEQENHTSLLASYDLKNLSSKNMYDKHSISLTCSGGNLIDCMLDSVNFMPAPPPPPTRMAGAQWLAGPPPGGMGFGRVSTPTLVTNPTGRTGDNCKYPRLNDIGFYADGDVVFSNVSVKHYNLPRSEVFGRNTGATYKIFEGLEGIKVEDGNIHVSNTLAYADPSYGSEPMVRTKFTTSSSSKIKDAKLYLTSRGINQFFINGKMVESDVVYHTDSDGNQYKRDYLAPGMIHFYGTMRYSTYNVKDLIESGENAMGAIITPGWWGDEYVYDPRYFNWYGERWGVLAKLVIKFEDGSRQEIVTNENDWKSFLDGPVTYSSLYHGEYYDARKENAISTKAAGVNGWSTAEYDDSAWTKARYTATAHVNFDDPDYLGRVDYPAHVTEVFKGKLLNTPSTRFMNNPERKVYIYDMGENIVGVPVIAIGKTLPEGAHVILRYGETMIKGDFLYPENAAKMDGMLYTENYRGARSLDRYIAKGTRGGETFAPGYTFHGWQFIEVSIMSDDLTNAEVDAIMKKVEVKGLQLSSLSEVTSTFTSSNKLLDKFFLNLVRSHYDNHVTIPTDCPQRNERLAFLGDQQIYSETAVYITDMTQFYSAFAQVARDYQLNTPSRNYAGSLTGRGSYFSKAGVPYDSLATQSNVAWPLGGLTIAWDVFANNNDLSLVREHWNSMVMFMQQFINSGQQDPKYEYLFMGGGLSNHLDLTNADNSGFDQNVTFGRALMYMATMADALGYHDQAEYYKNYFNMFKAEFNEYMINDDDVPLTYDGKPTTAQSSYAMPLYYGLVDLDKHPKFIRNFVERCKNEGTELSTEVNGVKMELSEYSVTTGFTGTPCLLGALAEHGQFYTAYRMLENENFASWLYPVKLGATSIWERWNTFTEYGPNSETMNSFNHYAFGVAAAFMITNSAGIQRGDNGELHRAGFTDFVLQPVPGGSLKYVNSTYKSINGLIKSSWTANPENVNKVSGVSDLVTYNAIVPANSTATLYLPLGSTITEETVKGFNNITGIEFIGITKRNNISVAEFKLAAGGYNFKLKRGKLNVKHEKGYVTKS